MFIILSRSGFWILVVIQGYGKKKITKTINAIVHRKLLLSLGKNY